MKFWPCKSTGAKIIIVPGKKEIAIYFIKLTSIHSMFHHRHSPFRYNVFQQVIDIIIGRVSSVNDIFLKIAKFLSIII